MPSRIGPSSPSPGRQPVLGAARATRRAPGRLRVGGGFDCFVAAQAVGDDGQVIGVDMTPEMLTKSRATAEMMGLTNVEFREGLLEQASVEDGWADVVISNGVINLCADKADVRRGVPSP